MSNNLASAEVQNVDLHIIGGHISGEDSLLL